MLRRGEDLGPLPVQDPGLRAERAADLPAAGPAPARPDQPGPGHRDPQWPKRHSASRHQRSPTRNPGKPQVSGRKATPAGTPEIILAGQTITCSYSVD